MLRDCKFKVLCETEKENEPHTLALFLSQFLSLTRTYTVSLYKPAHSLSLPQSPAASNEHNTRSLTAVISLSFLLFPYWILYQAATQTSSVFRR